MYFSCRGFFPGVANFFENSISFRWSPAKLGVLLPSQPSKKVREMSPEVERTDPSRIAPGRIAEIFDSLAGSYNDECRRKEYPGPSMVRELVEKCIPERTKPLRIVDLGCGTGLIGQVLRPMAGSLVGVDLSSRMLEVARGTGLYDVLEQVDALEHLNANVGKYDLIVAAGTFHYYGELSELLRACFDSLQPKGLLLFTLAGGPMMGDSFYYQPEEYFTHAPQYVMQQLGELGVYGGTIRRLLWPAPDQHSEYALVIAVERPEQVLPD